MEDLNQLKGLGVKKIALLNKMGIYTIKDLITFYPFRYDHIKRSNVEDLKDQDKIIIDGVIENVPNVFHFSSKKDKMNFKISTETKLFNVVIFNRSFMKSTLKVGLTITAIGKYDLKHNMIIASNIRLGGILKESIEPVYHTTYGMSTKNIGMLISSLLEHDISVDDMIPNYYKDKYDFLSKDEAIRIIHKPNDMENLKKARLRLKYEELFIYMLKMNYLKNNKKNKIGLKRSIDFNNVKKFIESLPFELTSDQIKAVDEIYNDLNSPNRMNRLLQGDVGSGKTIVAIISMYMNYLSGYQSALMAPTEILAIQHYNNIKNLFKNYNINIALLTGKTKSKDKKIIYEELNDGKIDFIIGTHSLITEKITYKNLGLVITDEQHRFGVNQRTNLKNKGITPDVLYMSATPIPRTYALTLYGDMDVSNIKSLPNGKKEIITTLKREKEIKDVLDAMYMEIKNNHQIYVVAPLIEESEKVDFENVLKLEEKMQKAFGKVCNIGVLHGKMKNEEKEDIMNKFANNKIQILISTTVIEVGIDVKNATMIVIFDAFRFGLSALHQLRGRVGRNNLQSYCILISNNETDRLNILTKTNDGFKISEEDFLLRGSGDLFGSRQSGDMIFKLADLKKDYQLLLKAKEDSEEYLNNNSDEIIKFLDKEIDLD